jgi:hypothetical protein
LTQAISVPSVAQANGSYHSLANSGPFEVVTLLGIEPRRRRCDNQTAVSRTNSPVKRAMALSTWCGRLVASDARTLGSKQFGGGVAFCLARTTVCPALLLSWSATLNLEIFLAGFS